MEAGIPSFAGKPCRRGRSSNRQVRSMITASPNDVVTDIAVDSGGKEESDNLHQPEALLSSSMEQQRSSQAPEEIGQSLLLHSLIQFPHRPRSMRSQRQISRAPNVGSGHNSLAVGSGGNEESDNQHQAESPLSASMEQRFSQAPEEIGSGHNSLAVGSGGNEESDNQHQAESPLSASMEQRFSQAPEEIGSGHNSLAVGSGGNEESDNQHQAESPLSASMEQRFSQAPEEIGVSEGCQVESHVKTHRTSQKRRTTRRSAYEKGCEIGIPRSQCRGQSRRGLKRNNTEKQKLDTSSFDKFLENLLVEFPEEKRASFICLDSLWFSLYSNDKGKRSNVLKWIEKKEIFTKKYVIVPIVMWGHWSLLILCHFGESGQSKFRTPCMLLLDSLKEANPKRLEPEIRRFILDICTMDQMLLDEKQVKKIPLLVPKVPQQRDDKECGNLVLYYINLFIESAPENFSISEGYPYFMTENWFDREGVESFYQRLELLNNTIDASDRDLHNASDADASDELIELQDGDFSFS